MGTHTPLMTQVDNVRRMQDAAFNQMGGVTPSLEQQREIAAEAARLEPLFGDLQHAMPEPGPTDSPTDYHVKLLSRLQRHSREFRNTDLRRLAMAGGLRGVDQQIIAEATAKANNPYQGSFLKPGQLRPIVRTDPGGETHTEFRGDPRSWMSVFMGPVVTAVRSWGDK